MTNFLKLLFILLLASFLFHQNILAQHLHHNKIQSEENEKWWANSLEFSSEMPFNSNTSLFEIADNNPINENATILFSNKGRVVWVDKPTTFTFVNDTLIINKNEENKMEVEKVGDNLRDSYLFASRRYFNNKENLTDCFYFNFPQYVVNVNEETQIEDIVKFATNINNLDLPNGILILNNKEDKNSSLLKNLTENILVDSLTKNNFILLEDKLFDNKSYIFEDYPELLKEKILFKTPKNKVFSYNNYSWETLNNIIYQAIIAEIMGNYDISNEKIVSSNLKDIGNNYIDEYLIIRLAQIQSFMPIMQLPLDQLVTLKPNNLEIIKNTILFHNKLKNYILESYNKSSLTGEPMIRSMEYNFPNQNFEEITDQFMLGDNILVAPVMTQNNERTVKLPIGKWKDDLGKTFNGGKTIEIEVPINRIPYYEKI